MAVLAGCLESVSAVDSAPFADSRPAGLQFQDAYFMLLEGDRLREKGEAAQALEMYQHALAEYDKLSGRFPDWQPSVTRFRTAYCQDQLEALAKQVVRSVPAASPPGTPSPSPSPSPPGADETADLKRSATRQLVEGSPDGASELLLRALRRDPDDAEVRLLIGMVRCAQGRYMDAVFVLEQLVDERPDHAGARLALGSAYLGMGQLDAAAREVDRAAVLAPDQPEAHYNKAQLLFARQPPALDSARRHYERSLELGGEPDPAFAARLRGAQEPTDRGKNEERRSGRRRVFPFNLFGGRHDEEPLKLDAGLVAPSP